MTAVRVPWSSASFLVYLGGLTILASTLALISVQSDEHGAAGLVLWAALIFIVLAGAAEAARNRNHLVTGGLLAVSSVAAFVIFVGAIWRRGSPVKTCRIPNKNACQRLSSFGFGSCGSAAPAEGASRPIFA